MVGRTHVVHAIPITFGHKCAIWLRELARHRQRLLQVEPRVLVGGLVGAVGTHASFGAQGAALEARVMKRLWAWRAGPSRSPGPRPLARKLPDVGFAVRPAGQC